MWTINWTVYPQGYIFLAKAYKQANAINVSSIEIGRVVALEDKVDAWNVFWGLWLESMSSNGS
jgi:hypothetical protein